MKARALLALAALIASQAFAQTAPSFEVASVKLIPDLQGVPGGFSFTPRRSGGRMTWATNAALLLRYAFNLPAWRIVRNDKPDDQFYQIDATMDPASTDDQVRAMMRKLLEDRFALTTHREKKEVQGYALTVAKNGPKIKPGAPGEPHALPDYLSGKPSDAFEGRIFVSAEGKGISALTGRGVTIAQLADQLSATLGTLVLDKTALAGSYYFGFKFLSVASVPVDDAEGVTIFTALQDELGLKLEKQKGEVEVLVVERFEKPSGN